MAITLQRSFTWRISIKEIDNQFDGNCGKSHLVDSQKSKDQKRTVVWQYMAEGIKGLPKFLIKVMDEFEK